MTTARPFSYADYMAGNHTSNGDDRGSVDNSMSQTAWDALTSEQQWANMGGAGQGQFAGNASGFDLYGQVLGGSGMNRSSGAGTIIQGGPTMQRYMAANPNATLNQGNLVALQDKPDESQLQSGQHAWQDPESGLWLMNTNQVTPELAEQNETLNRQASQQGIFGGSTLQNMLTGIAFVVGGAAAGGAFAGEGAVGAGNAGSALTGGGAWDPAFAGWTPAAEGAGAGTVAGAGAGTTAGGATLADSLAGYGLEAGAEGTMAGGVAAGGAGGGSAAGLGAAGTGTAGGGLMSGSSIGEAFGLGDLGLSNAEWIRMLGGAGGSLLNVYQGNRQQANSNQQSGLNRDLAREFRYTGSDTPYQNSSWARDPSTGQMTQTTTLKPEEQAQLDRWRAIREQRTNDASHLTDFGAIGQRYALPSLGGSYAGQNWLTQPGGR